MRKNKFLKDVKIKSILKKSSYLKKKTAMSVNINIHNDSTESESDTLSIAGGSM